MSVGARLREAREARGLSLDGLARTIRVQPRVLAAIERDDIAGVPPRPFGRGFVGSYAREIGLDPERMARDYFAQFAPAQAGPPVPGDTAPSPRPPLTLASLGALAIVAALALVAVVTWTRRPAPAGEQAPAPVGTSGSTTAAAPVTAAPAAAPLPVPAEAVQAPAAAPAAAPVAPLTIVLAATVRPAWVGVRADGDRVLFRTLQPGSPQTITASRSITLRVGDAGALQWQINNREARVMGRSGQVREMTVTPANAGRIR